MLFINQFSISCIFLCAAISIIIHILSTIFFSQNQSDKPAQLIFYDRPDTSGPKHSLYSITPVHDPELLKVGGFASLIILIQKAMKGEYGYRGSKV